MTKLDLANNREANLFRAAQALRCPACKAAQIQLVRFTASTSHWRCRMCRPRAEWTIEEKDELREGRASFDACRVCEAPIPSAELCADCAKGNNPFQQSKHGAARLFG